MAELVAKAFAGDRERQMIEAPTGTGKTLAYLVPAIEMARASGRTSVITPHSRVLQDQILATLEDLESELEPFSKVVPRGGRTTSASRLWSPRSSGWRTNRTEVRFTVPRLWRWPSSVAG